MTDFHLRGTGLEDHSLLNEDQVVTTKKRHQLTGGTDRPSRRRRRLCTSCRCWIVVALLSTMWLAFFGLWLYFSYFAPSSGKHRAGEVGHNSEATLVVLPELLADETGAYCLDGSPPSYYFRNASSKERETSWLVFLESGEWCYNATDCARLSTTTLGSSHMLNTSKEFYGILSANFTVNPDFYDWNVAVINYCDGASFSGSRDLPVEISNKTIYYRGIRVLDAVINHLLHSTGMARADRILLTGASAGGLAVFLHADHVNELIPDGVSFKAMADAGFFLDEKNIGNADMWRTTMKGVYDMQQVQGSLDEDCLLAKGTEKWECFFPEYAYPYINTPIFVINSALDYWTQLHILNLKCSPQLCDEIAKAFIKEHQRIFLQRTDQVNRYDKDGMFISSCYAHSQTDIDTPWMNYEVVGETTRQAFSDWYFGRSTPARSRYVDCDSGLNCNPSCAETWRAEFFESTVCLTLSSDECLTFLH